MAENVDGTIKLNLSVDVDTKSVNDSIKDLSNSLKANIKGATEEASTYMQKLEKEFNRLSDSTKEKLLKGYRFIDSPIQSQKEPAVNTEIAVQPIKDATAEMQKFYLTTEQVSTLFIGLASGFAELSNAEFNAITGSFLNVSSVIQQLTTYLTDAVGGIENFSHILEQMNFQSFEQMTNYLGDFSDEIQTAIETTFVELNEFTGGVTYADQAFMRDMQEMGSSAETFQSRLIGIADVAKQLPAVIRPATEIDLHSSAIEYWRSQLQSSFNAVNMSAEEYGQHLAELESLEEQFNNAVETDVFKGQMSSMVDANGALDTAIERFGELIEQIDTLIELGYSNADISKMLGVEDATAVLDKLIDMYANLEVQLNATNKAATDLATRANQADLQALAELQEKIANREITPNGGKITDKSAYEAALRRLELTKQIAEQEERIQQLEATRVANQSDENKMQGTLVDDRLLAKINDAKQSLTSMRDEMAQLNGEGKATNSTLGNMFGITSRNMSDMKDGWSSMASTMLKTIDQLVKSLQKMGAFGPDMLKMSYDLWAGFDEAFDKIGDGMNNLFQIPDNLSDAISQGLGAGASMMEEFGAKCEEVINNIDKDFEEGARGLGDMAAQYGGFYGQLASYVIDEVADKINKIQAIFGKAASATGKYISLLLRGGQALVSVFQQLGEKLKSAGSKILSLFKGVDSKMPSAKKLLNLLIKYGLGVRSIYMLFRKVRTMITEGFKSMAQFSDRTNKALSNVTSAWNQLKGQISATFEPILVTIEPILIRIINLLTEATLRVTKFIGALAGTSKVLKATLIYKNFADSVGSANKQLAGFDELNNLTSSSGGSDANGNLNGWEWVDSEFPSWWESFQAQWNSNDLSQFGNDVADKILEMLDKIPWFKIQSAATDMGARLATFLNGFLSPDFGYSIGKTIANGFTTAINFVNKFLEKLDFGNIGDTLASAVNGLVDGIEFDNVRKILENGLNGILEALTHFREGLNVDNILEGLDKLISFDTDRISENISNLINSFVGDSDQWSKGGSLINKFITNLIETGKQSVVDIKWEDVFENLMDWVDGIDFQELGEKLSESFMAIVERIDAHKLSLTISHVIKSALRGIIAFLNGLDGAELDAWIQDFLEGLDVMTIVDMIVDIIIKITDLIPWETIGEALGAGLPRLLASFSQIGYRLFGGILNTVIGFGKQLVLGWLDGMLSHLTLTIVSTILLGPIGTVVGGIIGYILNLFGIGSDGKSTVSGGWAKSIMQSFADNIIAMKDAVLEKMNIVKAWVLDVFSNIRDKAIERTTAMKDKVVSIFGKLKEALKVPINGIISFINTLISAITTGINKIIESLNSLTISPPQWMKDAASAFGVSLGDVNFNIPKIPSYTIPALAKGAVLPPNKPFLAQLGDQKNGTNIETPLSTMMEAFNMAFAQNSSDEQMMALMQQQIQLLQIIAEKEFGITNKQIFKSVQTSAKEYKYTTGRTAFT